MIDQLSDNLFRFQDTCSVYLIRCGETGMLIDFGSGAVLDALGQAGVRRITDVLITHHHRDQCEGLALAKAHGARVWVPETEQELFSQVDAHWQARELFNNYNVRQDRFSLLEPVPVDGVLQDYAQFAAGPAFTVLPTPGHTPGSISLLAEIDGSQVAFTGDLIAAPGKVWSASALQWSYAGSEGAAAGILSLLDLKSRHPHLLLPSHGDPIYEPESAIDLLVERFWQMLQFQQKNPRLSEWIAAPYLPVSPHLLRNRTSLANSYVLLSESGHALLIDYGYDFMIGLPPGYDRASRRPWLYSLPALKRDFGVTAIDAVLPTHYHDDHVAGLNLLRRTAGVQVWAAENVAPVLSEPARYDLPCLWFDPIPVDRVLPLEQPIPWQEYTFSLHALPGHTLYAAAISFEVDGLRVLATGDQYQGAAVDRCNPVYQNLFQPHDYRRSAELIARLQPDLILPGHWDPIPVQPGYISLIKERGEALERLHNDLLPGDLLYASGGDVTARIQPYQVSARPGEPFQLTVEIRSPLPARRRCAVFLQVPSGWLVDCPQVDTWLEPGDPLRLPFSVTPPLGKSVRRARLAADLTLGERHLGQRAEALVSVEPAFE